MFKMRYKNLQLLLSLKYFTNIFKLFICVCFKKKIIILNLTFI